MLNLVRAYKLNVVNGLGYRGNIAFTGGKQA